MEYILSLDQGTTSSRAILFDSDGNLHGSGQRELEQHLPHPGWVEHDPVEIWSDQVDAVRQALARTGVTASEVRAVGITNQRETTLLWERSSGRPLSNAIVWQDRRTASRCDALREEGLEPMFRERTGLLLDPYFSATKLEWMLDHIDGARDRAAGGELAFGTVDSWLVYRLTQGGVHVTDVSNASRTLLWNLHTQDWDDELLEVFRIPRAILPEVRDSSEVYGEITGIEELRGVPIGGILGDQQAALAGQLCTEPGLAKNTYGTGCFLLLNTGGEPRKSTRRLLTTAAWRRNGEIAYALEGSTFIGGAVVQWLRDGLKLIRESSDVEALAASVEDNGGVFLVPAFVGLGAPHWDPYARGAMFGITRGTSAGHIARAAVESMAYQVADLADAMEPDAGGATQELRVDGGAAVNDALLQFQADILRVPVVRPTVVETTALGAAYMAGLAVGQWRDIEDLRHHRNVDRRFEPRMPASQARALRERWTEAVERAGGWETPATGRLETDP